MYQMALMMSFTTQDERVDQWMEFVSQAMKQIDTSQLVGCIKDPEQ